MERIFAAVCLMAVLACGSAPNHTVTAISGHRDIIPTAEIESYRTAGMTAYDLVVHLRPEYLRNRGINNFRSATAVTATVYLNGSAYGGIDSLKNLDAASISQVQYLSASDATTRFGTDHAAGAILVSTR
jgi:hypothetical protein